MESYIFHLLIAAAISLIYLIPSLRKNMIWGGPRSGGVRKVPISFLAYLLGIALFIVLAYGDYFDVNVEPVCGVILAALYCVNVWDHVKFKYPIYYLLGIAFFATLFCEAYLDIDTGLTLLVIMIALICFGLWHKITSE